MQNVLLSRFVTHEQHIETSAPKSNHTQILRRSGKRMPRRCWDSFFSAVITANDKDTVADLQKSSEIFLLFWHSIPSARESWLQIALKSSRSQISSAWLLRKINQCPLWSSRFWWPGHRSVPVRYKHVQIRWRVPTNWKHGDLHLWL